ncbi:MAG: sortase [Clostridiales bacterium]|nr:sortase [Clostridiales bacterium]
MKKHVSDNRNEPRKRKRVFLVLMIFAGILLLTGVGLLLVEPIKSIKREKITDDAVEVMASQMSQALATAGPSATYDPESDIEATYIVPRDGNEVPGEDYDFFDDDEGMQASVRAFVSSRQAKLPKNVTLVCIGVIKIESIGKTLPVWNSTSTVALRYGVGLYEQSVKPGKPGNSAILGHNMQNTTLFSKLKKANKGDNVKFIKLDGTVLNYRIDDIKIVYKNELYQYVIKSASETQQLTLVTCANDDYGHGYRRVVICHPVN